MQRHIYRFVTLLLVFAGSLVFMIGRLETITFHSDTETVTEMSDATFPTVYLLDRDHKVNPLYGYSTNMDAGALRETLTPLDEELCFYTVIEEHGSRVKRMLYEIWDTQNTNMLDSGSISAMEEYEGNKLAKIRVRVAVEAEQEYFVKLTAVTATGKKIRYYTRIKYMPKDCLDENLAFVSELQDMLTDKEKAEGLRRYLETDSSMDNHTLAYVNIHSSFDLVTWGEMKPVRKTELIPVITENNENVTSVQFKYMIEAQTAAGVEEYYVMEFFRVKWTTNNRYLLAYERTMNAVFDPAHTSMAKSELKLGISTEEKPEIVSAGENNCLCFVKERELWYYNVAENNAVRVFSFRNHGEYDPREWYDQHNIRILDMDDSGNIDFMVYGYMNRGVYEGRVAIVLYRFYAGENRIEEQVYIPLETNYQMLKEDLDRLSYVTEDSVFYFTLSNTLYAYNIITKRVEIITEDITEESCMVFPDKSKVVWQNSSRAGQSDKLVIMNLETKEKKEIAAPTGKLILLLGGIDVNMIYGIADRNDLWEEPDGSIWIPMEKICIASDDGTKRKEYVKEDVYIFHVSVNDNVITLDRGQKKSDEWVSIEQDHILNRFEEKKAVIGISERVTEQTLTELYVTLPDGYALSSLPSVTETMVTVIYDETILRLEVTLHPGKRYYSYLHGEVTDSYRTAAEAIAVANDGMGYAVNEYNQMIWERGAKKRSAMLRDVDIIRAESSVGTRTASELACIRMLLSRRYVEAGNEEIASISGGMTEVLDYYLGDRAVNLSGATLDEVLYYVSKGCPVITLAKNNQTVLLVGYDEYTVTWINPVTGLTVRSSLASAEEELNSAGKIYVSYIP